MKVFRFLIYFALIICCSETIIAQEIRHGAFFAPVIKNTSMLNQYAVIAGARGGWIINETFVIGAAFYSVTNKIQTNYTGPDNSIKYNLDFNCGGLEFELVYPSKNFLHGSIVMFLGGGGGKFKPDNGNAFSPYGLSLLIWEPQLNLELNLKSWLHLDTGISYRIINGFDNYFELKPGDISGISGVIALKFGSY